MTTIAIIELLLKYGPEAFIKLIKGLQNDNPTPDEIRNLKVNEPERFFD